MNEAAKIEMGDRKERIEVDCHLRKTEENMCMQELQFISQERQTTQIHSLLFCRRKVLL